MSFLNQKHRNVIANWVDAMTCAAFESVLFLVVRQRFFAEGASEDFEQIFVDHDTAILPPFPSSVATNANFPGGVPDLVC